jgi:hypothetical protein
MMLLLPSHVGPAAAQHAHPVRFVHASATHGLAVLGLVCCLVACLQEEQGLASPALASRSLSRKDATAFVRAARRYGLKARLPAIAAEIGGAVEEAGPQQQLSLWRALVEGCRRALELGQVAEQMHEAKVSDDSIWDGRVSSMFVGVC